MSIGTSLDLETAIAQRFSFRAVVGILSWFITKLVVGETHAGLMATVNDRDVRLPLLILESITTASCLLSF